MSATRLSARAALLVIAAAVVTGALATRLLLTGLLGPPGEEAPPAPSVAADLGALVPLGPDPESGLPELAVAGTGEIPTRDASGRLALGPDAAIVLVRLPAGRFRRGATRDPEDPYPDEQAEELEGPVREVTIRSFLIAKHELTVAQWARLTGTAAGPAPARAPATDLTWHEARERLAVAGLRLPSEAEWEYACRAGTTTRYASGDETADLLRVGWTEGNAATAAPIVGEAPGSVHPVGRKPPNAFGLHDVHGNAAEWCEDRWHRSYRGAPDDGSARTDGATLGRVIRGGSWFHGALTARSAARRAQSPGRATAWIGVRPARSIEETGVPPR
jgi:formylglycine-generating enzyme required for sulfatase activity